MRGRHLHRSPSSESISDKFKSWNTRSSFAHRAPLRPVHENREEWPMRHKYAESTTTLHEYAQDSAIDLSEMRERYTSGDRIFQDHERISQRPQSSRDPSRSRVFISSRPSTHSEFDKDALFLERIEAMRHSQKVHPTPSFAPPSRNPAEERTVKRPRSTSRATRKNEKALPPLPSIGGPQPRKTFIDSIRSTRYLRNMRSLSQLNTYVNPHESMDFRCVGSPIEAVNAMEEAELQSERDELLHSINLTRTRMCDQSIRNLERSAHLDREAQEAAFDMDKFDSVPAGSTCTMDEETATAQLIGPAGFPGLATGERWASLQYKLASHTKPVCKLGVNVATSATCPCHNYNMFAAITDDTWRSIGMARTALDRRWVVLLSASAPDNDETKSSRSLLTPVSSIREPRSKSRLRRTEPALHCQ